MWNKIKSLAGTAALTLLIWLAADQNVSETRTVEVSVRLVSSNGFAIIRTPGPVTNFNVTVTGRRRRLAEFWERVENQKQKGIPFDAVVGPAQQPSLDSQVISSDIVVRWVREVATANLTIQEVSPPTVTVLIDLYQTVPGITVQPGFGVHRVSSAVCTPTTVDARVPRFAAATLRKDMTVRADAEPLIRDFLRSAPAEPSFQVTVPLSKTVDPGIPIEFTPAEVTITGVVETVTSTLRIGPVQILFLVPQEVQRRYVLTLSEGSNLRPDILVTGSERSLQQLDARDIRAFVEVKASDMVQVGQEIVRDAVFIFPPELPGLKMHDLEPPHQIKFRLVPHSADNGIDD